MIMCVPFTKMKLNDSFLFGMENEKCEKIVEH